MKFHTSNPRTLALLLAFFCFLAFPKSAQAQRGERDAVIQVNQSFSAGRAWRTNLPDIGVDTVTVTLRRVSGSSRTFVNLRFGERGGTFENGKREYLRDNRTVTLQWNVGGQRASGQPLLLNVYDGEVHIDSVRVAYSGSSSLSPRPPFENPRPRPPVGGGWNDPNYPSYGGGSQGNDGTYERCRYQRGNRRPRIELGRVKPSGGVFSGKYRIEGSIFASCVQEAGYYEEGRLKDKIEFQLDDRFNRREFSVQARSGRNGEIRVYTVDGQQEYISIDDEIQRNSGGSNSGGYNGGVQNPFGF